MIIIDGAYGEGGGQILRTSASLAAITGQTVRIERIRAGRAEPGLKAQHLTAIGAAMQVCDGALMGGHVGSTEVTLIPGPAVRPGAYEFDIGTAGSTSLVLQTVLLPLLLARGESRVVLIGGTHNTHAPSSDYLRHTFLRAARLPVDVEVERVGFFPRGGGRMVANFHPATRAPIRLPHRGERKLLTATVTASEGLPLHILERARTEIERRATAAAWPLDVLLAPGPSLSPGMAIHLDATFGVGFAGCTALGRKGLPTERVVEDAWTELETFERTDATVDEHLADQLILPGLFAGTPSEYRASRVTEHLRTMAWLVPQFGVGTVIVDEASGDVRIEPNRTARPI